MSYSPRIKRLGLAGLVVAAGIATSASAAEAATCSFVPETKVLRVQMTASNIVLESINGSIVAGELGTTGKVCAGSRSNLARVEVRSANPPGKDMVVVDEAFQKWGRLPLVAFTGSGDDDMVVNGSAHRDSYHVLPGLGAEIDLDGDLTADFRSSMVGTVWLNGNGDNDALSGAGRYSGFGPPLGPYTTTKLHLRGQAGDDYLAAGVSGQDILEGGADGDLVKTANAKAGDIAVGGPGGDSVQADKGDIVSEFEAGGVGGPTPGSIRPRKNRATTVKLAWEHPVSWRELGILTLTAHDRGKQVGSISFDPATKRWNAAGALRLVGHSSLAHTVKGVSTTLKVRVGPRLAGRKLDLRMQARNR